MTRILDLENITVEDAIISKHLLELSGGKLDLTSGKEVLSDSKDLLRKKPQNKSNQKKQGIQLIRRLPRAHTPHELA